jgi:hypothetical protein
MTIEPIDLVKQVCDEVWRDQNGDAPSWLGWHTQRRVFAVLLLLRGTLPTPNKRIVPEWRRRPRLRDRRPQRKMNAEERAFDIAMRKYFRSWRHKTWTPGQALDVLVQLGYKLDSLDFAENLDRFTNELSRTRARTRGVAPWNDVLKTAEKLGWSTPRPKMS